MTGFTRALGVRCSHCHVGEEGEPLNTYDFASDDNPNKERAREMLRMLGSINDHLKNIEPSGVQPVNMWCHTCHRGRPRPMTLAEELAEKYRSDGLESSVAHYAKLKEQEFIHILFNTLRFRSQLELQRFNSIMWTRGSPARSINETCIEMLRYIPICPALTGFRIEATDL